MPDTLCLTFNSVLMALMVMVHVNVTQALWVLAATSALMQRNMEKTVMKVRIKLNLYLCNLSIIGGNSMAEMLN